MTMHKLEQRKQSQSINKKWVRVTTVILYIIFVSLFGVILGLYYRFWWTPNYSHLNDISSPNKNGTDIASFSLKPVFNGTSKQVDVSLLVNTLMNTVSNSQSFIGSNLNIDSKYTLIDDGDVDDYEIVLSLIVSFIFGFFAIESELFVKDLIFILNCFEAETKS
jgi:hypothetical protein